MGGPMPIHQIRSDVPYDSSIYLIDSPVTVLVDSGTGLDHMVAERIERILNGRSLDIIVATHCHYDHVGGIASLVDRFGSEVRAAEPDAQAIREGDDGMTLAHMFGGSLGPVDVKAIEDGDVLDLGDRRLRVIRTPGHTRGSICLYDDASGTLISGDTLFESGFGRTDFPGGSMSAMRSSLRALSNIDIRELYPGHGSICENCGPGLIARALTLAGV